MLKLDASVLTGWLELYTGIFAIFLQLLIEE